MVVEQLGRYQLLGLIAAGGMAKVYLARVVGEGGFEREVAVKVMHDHLLHDADFVAMFFDEARLAARLRHPNVVPTLDVQKSAEALFLVMEFVEGLSLSALLRQLGQRTAPVGHAAGAAVGSDEPEPAAPLPLDVALRIALDMLGGLHAAHELRDRQGRPLHIVHRDVSPANVLCGVDGIARITDFGVARAEARLASTHGNVLKGKVPYLSPEQIGADTVDRRSDVYSAGAVLWEMLTGRRLFRGANQGVVLNQVTGGARTAPSEVNRQVPVSLDRVCMRALNVEPSYRFGTAASLADALEEAAEIAGVLIANPRRLGSYVRGFETNLARLEATESMMHIQLGAAALDGLRSAGGATPTGSGPRPAVTDSAQRISVPSLGRTPSGAVLDPSGDGGLVSASPGGKAAALLAGGGALLLGVALAVALFAGDEAEPASAAGDSAAARQYGAGGPEPSSQRPSSSPSAAGASGLATAVPSVSSDAGADSSAEPPSRRSGGRRGGRRSSGDEPLPSEFLPQDL